MNLNIINKIKQEKSLKERIFWLVVVAGAVITFLSALFTFFEGLGFWASIMSAACCVVILLLLAIAVKTKEIQKCYIAMCYIYGCLLLPILFFFCGGIDGGMMFYWIMMIFLCVPCLEGKQRVVTTAVIMATFIVTLTIGFIYPQFSTTLTRAERIMDISSSFVLISVSIIAVSVSIMTSYEKERKKNKELLTKLEILSQRDELTGAYNRRILFDEIDNTIYKTPEIYGAMMFDIDDFKKFNDLYGHLYGDFVLKKIAQTIMDEIDEGNGEIMARYGGEEFFCIIKTDESDVFERADRIRKNVEGIVWEGHSGLVVTISGGAAECSDCSGTQELISKVDQMLYFAKSDGKNVVKIPTRI